MALFPLAHVRFERGSRLHAADAGKATPLAQRTEARRDAEWLCIKKARSTVLGLQGPKLDRYGVQMCIRDRRDPPDDITEQMRNEAQFLNDRAVDQRNVADAAEPLYASLDDRQKQIFIEEMVRLSHERGLD